MRVSHETIYKSLFIQARGVLNRELLAHLRSRRIMRRGKTSSTSDQTRGQVIDTISIRDRPGKIEDRAIPGHWEGDLLSGAKNTQIATLVERTSRFVMLVQLDGKDSLTVVDALVRKVRELPRGLMTSLTWDQGTDLSTYNQDALDHVALSLNTRPRKTLGFLTPVDKLRSVVALTG
jgi:IS30 family transposase